MDSMGISAVVNRSIFVLITALSSASLPALEVEHLQYDLDRDGIIDNIKLVIPENWVDPGEFTKVEISFGNGKTMFFEEPGGWVSFADSADGALVDWFSTNNLLPSRRVVLLSDKTSNYLFLFGYAYASSPGVLEIIRFHSSRVASIYKNEFWPVAIEHKSETMCMVGRSCFSQGWGNNCFTYTPFNVLELGASVALDAKRTEDFNLRNYYGYVGADCSEAYAVVELNGRQLVVDEKTAREICLK